MKQVDRTIAPDVTEYGRLEFPQPVLADVMTDNDGHVRLMSLDRCPEPVCRVTVAWPVGLMDADCISVASMAAAALREGTSRYNASQISTALESNGAWFAAETVQEYTMLHLYALNRRIEPVLDILHDMIAAPAFPADRVYALRLRQAEAATQNRCKVAYMADIALRPLMTGKDHRRSRVSLPDDILSVERDDLQRYWQHLSSTYAPTVWVSGNITDAVISAVKSFASSLPVPAGAIDRPTSKIIYNPEAPEKIITHIDDVKQAAVAMGLPLPDASHPHHMMLRMAVTALGGYFGSRLNTNIREDKGLTYGIGANLRMSPQGAYLFIQAQADEAYVDQVVEETARELCGLWENPLSEAERVAIRRNQQSRLAGMLDSPFATLDYCLAMQQIGVGLEFFDRSQDALNFTADDIALVARKYLNPDRLSVSIACKS